MLGQRCRRRTSNKPAITARAVSVSSRANGTGPTLGQRWQQEIDIETSNAITVWLLQCQCQSSVNSTEHWRNTGVDGPTLPALSRSPLHVITHQLVTALVRE